MENSVFNVRMPSGEIAGSELSENITTLALQPVNVETLYNAAYDMYEEQLYGVAANLLLRANELTPDQPYILSELSSNFEELMDNHVALELLRDSNVAEHDALCCYLVGFNALMCGELDEALNALSRLNFFEINDDVSAYIETLESSLERADAIRSVCKLDKQNLTGWHMVINAGVLLHESPHGYDEGMSGRYCYLQDSYGLIQEGIIRLRLILEAGGVPIHRVVSAADRSSQIIALAAATMLDVPFEIWQPSDTQPGLVVIYDLKAVDDEIWKHLSRHHPGQILWVHANCWTSSPNQFTPDVMTMQYQTNFSPWDGGTMTLDPGTNESAVSEADTASEQEIAKRIVDSGIRDDSVSRNESLEAMIKTIKAVQGNAAAGIFRSQHRRSRQRKGSPVKSNFFHKTGNTANNLLFGKFCRSPAFHNLMIEIGQDML